MARGKIPSPKGKKRSATPRKGNWRDQITPEQKEQNEKERKERVDNALSALETELEDLGSNPDKVKNWLKALPSMHKYSANNIMLILWQKSEASRVASASKWNEEGRRITKGEKALRVLGPKNVPLYETDPATGKKRPKMEDILDAKGNPTGKKRQAKQRIYGAWLDLPVFDISQTTIVDEEKARGANAEPADQAVKDLEAVLQKRGITFLRGGEGDKRAQLELLSNPSMGGFIYGDPGKQTVVTRKGLTPAEEARVLAHELAHSDLEHGPYQGDLDRQRKELEAESTAYALLSRYGLEDETSSKYIASWKADKKKLRASMSIIQQSAHRIFGDLEEIQEQRAKAAAEAKDTEVKETVDVAS